MFVRSTVAGDAPKLALAHLSREKADAVLLKAVLSSFLLFRRVRGCPCWAHSGMATSTAAPTAPQTRQRQLITPPDA